MPRRTLIAALTIAMAAVGLPAFAPVADSLTDDLCHTSSATEATTALLGTGSELVEVAGDQALALEPLVAPGTRSRLLAVGDDVWCPAGAVNAVAATRGGLDELGLAELAATTLAAAHFDGVRVMEATQVAPGRVTLTTHARTNGVVADWDVELDALGVRRATWTATDFAQAPFTAETEGLTALPGATRTYERTATGLLEPTVTIRELATQQDQQDPSPFISVESPDGFVAHVVEGDATFYTGAANSLAGTGLPTVYGGIAPDPDTDTGVTQVDYLRIMGEGLEVNFEDFHGWGWRQGWVDEEGALYVDGALSAYCLACVLVSEYFNIHMSRAITPALDALGYSYPDERLALVNIVGHEMVHNYQNAYGKPDSVGGGRHNSYSEGMARFSETLHDYSHVSHQTESLVYANDTNGCNGWQGDDADAAHRAGPLTGQSYDACYFWKTVHGAYGIDAFLGVMENTAGLESGRPWEIFDDAIAAGTGDDLVDVLANFAAMSLTHDGYVWGNPANPETEELDWARFLDRWTPLASFTGPTVSATLRDGGTVAYRLPRSGTIDVSEGDGHGVALVVDDGTEVTTTLLSDGDVVDPGSGDAWIVLLNASTENSQVSATLR